MKAFATMLASLVLAPPVAQEEHSGHGGTAPAQAPASSAASAASMMGYSAAERAEGLREGRGMGLAMPAEGNGYPGPRHVLEMADQIGLTGDQRTRTQQLFDSMKSQASRLGTQLLNEEDQLNEIFRARRATPQLLEQTARAIGRTEAELEIVHLRTHLAMMQILTPEQVSRYVGLRRSGEGSGRTRPTGTPAPAEHDHQR